MTRPVPGAVLMAVAITLLVMSMLIGGRFLWYRARHARADLHLSDIFADDRYPVLLSDSTGTIIWGNNAASERLGTFDGLSVAFAVGESDENPIEFIRSSALAEGRARTSHATPEHTLMLDATRTSSGHLLWRISDQNAQTPSNSDDCWQVRADSDGNIAWMSRQMLDGFDRPPQRLDDLVTEAMLKPGRDQTLAVTGEQRSVRVTQTKLADDMVEVTFTPSADSEDTGQFETLPVPLLQLNRHGMVTRANRLARQLLSLEPGEDVIFGTLVEGLGRQVSDWLADAFDGRSRGRPEVVRASRAVDDLYVQVTLEQVGDDADGQMMAVLHDATELKTLEAQFVQSQKMQAIGQLAGGVAHDFNNLLTAISGHCDLLLLRHEPGDQDFADLEQINQNANRAASLVGQLLAFSRKQNLRPETLDLRDILSDLTHLLNRLVGERVSLSFSHDPRLQMVRADKRQLEQVIMNLVVNARDAMPEGGAIRVATRMLELQDPEGHDRVEVPAGTYVLVQVTDQGVGISDDKMPKIFEPFFTTKRTGEGTGLGLSTAYGIVKQTGGYIFAESVLDQGTTFTLYFPATTGTSPVRRLESSTRDVTAAVHLGRILLVEDEAPVRAFAARALRLRGHIVIEAEHAEAALKISSDSSVEIDVFVTDVIMPGRDGPSWVREALEARPDTRVVFVSGYAEESFAESQAAIPNSRFLPKPFSLVELTKAVEAELAR